MNQPWTIRNDKENRIWISSGGGPEIAYEPALFQQRYTDLERLLRLDSTGREIEIYERMVKAEAKIKDADDNAKYILENWLKPYDSVRVRPGGGVEDLQASLTVSIQKLVERIRKHEQT